MSFDKCCQFYQDSKCILKGGCCDLDCGLTFPETDYSFYDDLDEFTKWKLDQLEEQKRLESKLS